MGEEAGMAKEIVPGALVEVREDLLAHIDQTDRYRYRGIEGRAVRIQRVLGTTAKGHALFTVENGSHTVQLSALAVKVI